MIFIVKGNWEEQNILGGYATSCLYPHSYGCMLHMGPLVTQQYSGAGPTLPVPSHRHGVCQHLLQANHCSDVQHQVRAFLCDPHPLGPHGVHCPSHAGHDSGQRAGCVVRSDR